MPNKWSWKDPKVILSTVTIVAGVFLMFTGSVSDFVQGGVLMAGVMGFVYKHLDQRMPNKEEFLEMVREMLAEDFEYYLGIMTPDDEKEEGES